MTDNKLFDFSESNVVKTYLVFFLLFLLLILRKEKKKKKSANAVLEIDPW